MIRSIRAKVGQIYEGICPTSTMWCDLLNYPVIKKYVFAREQVIFGLLEKHRK